VPARSLHSALLLLALAGCVRVDVDDPPESDAGPDTETDAGPGGVVDTADGVRWRLGDPVRCADPAARAAAPYRPYVPPGDWAGQPSDPESDALFVGGGLAAGDVTGDGRLDLLVTSATSAFGYWVQVDDLGFEDARDRLPPMPERTAGVTLVDLDDDGDLDAYVAVFRGPSLALLNDGHGTFHDAAAELGLQGPEGRRSISSSWADVDGDGDLDGFVAGYGPLASPDAPGLPPGDPSSLFLREGAGFRDVVPDRAAPDPLLAAHTFGGAFVDADQDGRLDLYLVDDFGWTFPSELLRNDAGVLTVAKVGAESRRENMGLGVGDVDGDERPDFLVTAWDGFSLFESDPGGTWTDTALARGLFPDLAAGQDVAWGAELADLDDDGDLDAVVALGHLPVRSANTNPLEQPDGLWLQEADGRFHDVAAAWGVADRGRGRGVLTVDLDRDGYLDLVRTDLRGPPSIDLASCGDAAWLRIDLRQPAPNPFAIGARIRVGLGDRVLVRDLLAGGTGYGSGGPPEVHVGLGAADEVDFVEVVWPDGSRSRREHVGARRWLRVERD
jgi:hypothetical protein